MTASSSSGWRKRIRRWDERDFFGRSTPATGFVSTQPRLTAKRKRPCMKFSWFWTVLEESPSARFPFR